MAVRGSAQITLVDLLDAYGVYLTSEAHTFIGSTSTLGSAQSVATQVVALLGAEQVAASVVLSEIDAPDGVTVTKDSDATSPTLTISLAASVASSGTVDIPIHVGDLTFMRTFSFAIAFRGGTGSAGKGISGTPAVTYQAGSSGTTVPAGTWLSSIPAVSAGQYLWTRTVTSYTDSTSTTSYSVGMMGATGGPGKGVSGTPAVTYQAGTSGTAAPTGTWTAAIPTVPAGQYLWSRTVTTYTDSSTSTSYSVAYSPEDGADAMTFVVTSSNGDKFKNESIATVLTFRVYKAGVELTGTALTAEGTIKWYKDGSTTAVATGQTLTIDAGDVTGKAVYVGQLEG